MNHYSGREVEVLPREYPSSADPSAYPFGGEAPSDAFALAYSNTAAWGLRNAWDEQRDKWLSAKGKKSACTRRAYEDATRRFVAFVGLDWWLVTADHVRAWQEDMEQAGLSPATVNQRLSAVSSFYSWVIREQKLDAHGVERSLFFDAQGRTRSNPFRANNLDRVQPRKIGGSRAIGPAVLVHMINDINVRTLEGARDCALLKVFLLTGWRSDETLKLKWGDIRPNDQRPGEWIAAWSGKGGKEQDDAFPVACYGAIVHYLTLAGRWAPGQPGHIQPGDYIWQPIRDHGTHNFPNVAASPLAQLGRGAGGEGQRHISPTQANNILRKHLRRALRKTGLTKAEAATRAHTYHVHNLRHTFAHNMRKAKFDVLAISKRMHHANIAITQRYLDSLEAPVDDYSQALQLAMGI